MCTKLNFDVHYALCSYVLWAHNTCILWAYQQYMCVVYIHTSAHANRTGWQRGVVGDILAAERVPKEHILSQENTFYGKRTHSTATYRHSDVVGDILAVERCERTGALRSVR